MRVTPGEASELTLVELLSDGLFTDGDWVESKDQDPDGEVRLIQLADIGEGVFRDRSSRFLTLAKAKELGCTFLVPGDVLVARMPEPLGRACLFPGVGQPAVTAVDICILRPNPQRARPEWLVTMINTPQFRYSMQQFVRGTTRHRISRKNLGSLVLPVRGLLEQAATAHAVTNLESKRSDASRHLAAARRAIARFRQTALIAGCSGRLTAQWREENPDLATHALIQDRRGAVLPNMGAPREWIWSQLADIAYVKGGVQKGAKFDPKEPTREVPYLRVANVQRGWLDLSEMKTIVAPERTIEELRLQPGDVLFNEGGDRDKLGRGWIWEGQIDECIHQNHVFRARLNLPGMQPRFVSWYGNTIGASYFLAGGKQTVNLASLNMSTLKRLPVPVPSPEEQAEIVRRIDELLTLADELRGRLEAAERSVDQCSQAALGKAFRGELPLTLDSGA